MFPVLVKYRARQGGALSGGEQQQLAIGRALVAQPKLLLLDEPTEGIQPSIVQEIGNALTRIRKELKDRGNCWSSNFCTSPGRSPIAIMLCSAGVSSRPAIHTNESPDTVAHLLNI